MSEAMQSTEVVFEFGNVKQNKNVKVEGVVTDKSKNHDAEWCNEIWTIEADDGVEFEVTMGDTKNQRHVEANGTYLGKWFMLIEK